MTNSSVWLKFKSDRTLVSMLTALHCIKHPLYYSTVRVCQQESLSVLLSAFLWLDSSVRLDCKFDRTGESWSISLSAWLWLVLLSDWSVSPSERMTVGLALITSSEIWSDRAAVRFDVVPTFFSASVRQIETHDLVGQSKSLARLLLSLRRVTSFSVTLEGQPLQTNLSCWQFLPVSFNFATDIGYTSVRTSYCHFCLSERRDRQIEPLALLRSSLSICLSTPTQTQTLSKQMPVTYDISFRSLLHPLDWSANPS